MAVTAVINIEQFDTGNNVGNVREEAVSVSFNSFVQELAAGRKGEAIQRHLPAVSQPVPVSPPVGFVTSNKEDWSDSPSRQPLLLYRYRFGWGRDRQELFPTDGFLALNEGDDGARWGNLDDVGGLAVYERDFPLSAAGSVRQFSVQAKGSLQERDTSFQSSFLSLKEFIGPSGEQTVEQFPFLITALPEPSSEKNPIDTDVFIRLSNFTNTLASGTITLYLDDVIQQNLQIEEFFGGLGGFDVTWNNSNLFDYGAQVDVRWEFSDTDTPANDFVIRYPFYTVEDKAGPRINNLVPTDQANNISIEGPIQFDVEDFEEDVDIETLVVYVNNLKIVDGKTGSIDLIRLENKQGYTVKITPENAWLYGDLIPVAIFVNDVNGNSTFFTYSFTTIESNPPRLINIDPVPCAINVPVGTDIKADVIGGGHGLDKDSIIFTVDEVERTGQVILIPIVHRDD